MPIFFVMIHFTAPNRAFLKNLCLTASFITSIAFFFSCAASPAARETPSTGGAGGGSRGTPETAPKEIPERPAKPAVPEYIMGAGVLSHKDMSAFLLEANPAAEKTFAESLAFLYTEEAAAEGVNHDAAFAQMCLETGFLKYGGLVTPNMNNFCGLGAIGPGQNGASFPTPRLGVRAHIQHLKAYASEAPLKNDLVDPRFRYVRRGSSPAIKGLAGTWAADRSYAEKINGILERLYNFSFGS